MNANKEKLDWAVITTAGWFPLAVFSLYLKHTEIYRRYFSLIADISGLGDQSSLANHLFFFKEDILLNFLIIPLIIIALLFSFPRNKYILFFLQFLTLSLLILHYANLHSWNTVGRSLTYTAAINAITFGLNAPPEFLGMYIDMDSGIKFAVLVVATIVMYSSGGILVKSTLITKFSILTLTCIFIFALTVSSIGYSSKMREFPLNGNFILSSLQAFFEDYSSKENDSGEFSKQQLAGAFRELTKFEADIENHLPYGSSNGNDVIIIGLETGSSQFMDLENDLGSFPAIKSLSNNGLIMAEHYSTFPTSAESLFSVFSSIYPPRSYYSTCVISSEKKITQPFPGLISSFAAKDYKTSLYLPYLETMPIDIALNENLGFRDIYHADEHPEIQGLSRDKQAFNKMLRDVKDSIELKKSYVAVFLPQFGHAPWPDKPATSSIKEHGRKVAIVQDSWLLELIDLLEQTKRLDHTTIVVLSDHGIRTKQEDPEFRTGFIDEYSFKVPFIIFSKSSFSKKEYITHMTSHVDVTPTLLDLHGIRRDKLYEQGLPVWDKGIDQRITFYLGDWYFGADAYILNGIAKMNSNTLDVSFSSTMLHFDYNDISFDRGESNKVKETISKMYEIQDQWVEKFMCRN